MQPCLGRLALPGAVPAAAAPAPWLTQQQWQLVQLAGLGLLLLVAASVVGGYLIEQGRRRRAVRRARFEEVMALSHEDVTALGADLAAVDTIVPVLDHADPEAMHELANAHEWFERAIERLEQAATPEELAPVSSSLEAARFHLTSARSRIEGHGRLRRRPPCFFDTRHGPSVNDVGWIPPGAAARPVPACAACMALVNDNAQPPVRLVRSAGEVIPFYQAPPHFESWFGGYFGGAAQSLVEGFPLGRALDDGFAGARNMGVGHGYVPAPYAETGMPDQAGGGSGPPEQTTTLPASYADTGRLDEAGVRIRFNEAELSEYVPDSDLGDSYDDASPWRLGWRESRSRLTARRRRARADRSEGEPQG
jgi:hypothetical protein